MANSLSEANSGSFYGYTTSKNILSTCFICCASPRMKCIQAVVCVCFNVCVCQCVSLPLRSCSRPGPVETGSGQDIPSRPMARAAENFGPGTRPLPKFDWCSNLSRAGSSLAQMSSQSNKIRPVSLESAMCLCLSLLGRTHKLG